MKLVLSIFAALLSLTVSQFACPEVCFRGLNRALNSCDDAPSFCRVQSCTIPSTRRGPIPGFVCTDVRPPTPSPSPSVSPSPSPSPSATASPTPSPLLISSFRPLPGPEEDCPNVCRRNLNVALRDCDDAPNFCRVRPCEIPARRQGRQPRPGQACVDPRETPEPTTSVTPTPSVPPTPSSSASSTPSATPSISTSPSSTASPSISQTPTPTPSVSATPSISVSPSVSVTPSPSPTASPSETPSPSPTQTPTPSPSPVRCPEICSTDARRIILQCRGAPRGCRLKTCRLSHPTRTGITCTFHRN